ncbi:MAG: DUF1015 domain-containing protein [Acholeplasmataceae bacterium]
MLKNHGKSPIALPNILLPNSGIDMSKWAVIACDQFTSQPKYWEDLKIFIGEDPSTYHMVLPEVYLDQMTPKMIDCINQTMASYLEKGLLKAIGPSMMLVERTTHYLEQRLGLMMNIDLEDYSYERHAKPLIRTTERTIIERIPPRLMIRNQAPLELTHVMLLVDDDRYHILENLFERKDEFDLCYDFKLNMDGGHIKGYQIKSCDGIIEDFMQFIKDDEDPLLFIVGDGNHSLATAKAHWEDLKKTLSSEEIHTHPARFALVEVVNLYNHGLDFEGIHRVLFDVDASFIEELQQAIDQEYATNIYDHQERQQQLFIPKNAAVAYEQIQAFIDIYLENHPLASIDYIHGEQEAIEVCKRHENSIGIIMPKIEKKEIFPFIKQGKVLPRKSFSMGSATAKRYYLESQLIIKSDHLKGVLDNEKDL